MIKIEADKIFAFNIVMWLLLLWGVTIQVMVHYVFGTTERTTYIGALSQHQPPSVKSTNQSITKQTGNIQIQRKKKKNLNFNQCMENKLTCILNISTLWIVRYHMFMEPIKSNA